MKKITLNIGDSYEGVFLGIKSDQKGLNPYFKLATEFGKININIDTKALYNKLNHINANKLYLIRLRLLKEVKAKKYYEVLTIFVSKNYK